MATMPPRIVIALTGPIGSGCSTLARFFDDLDGANRNAGNRFLNQLIEKGLILNGSDGLEVGWEDVNREVSAKLGEYHRARGDHKISGGDGEGEVVSRDERSVFKELGRLLERRESLKALTFLKPYYPKGSSHLFRTLSMSDIIVFRALCNVAAKKKSGDKDFDDLAGKAIARINRELKRIYPNRNRKIGTIVDFYDAILKPDPRVGLIKAFEIIHNEIRVLKTELLTTTNGRDTAILQRFGNSIRKAGDPFADESDGGSPNEHCVQLAADMERIINLLYKSKRGAFFVVDCLRSPHEVSYFRQRFPLFHCLSIFAEKDHRFKRRFRHLMAKNAINVDREEAKGEFEKLDKLDRGKQIGDMSESLYKQNVTSCVQLSDYAINNAEGCSDMLRHTRLSSAARASDKGRQSGWRDVSKPVSGCRSDNGEGRMPEPDWRALFAGG